MNNNDHSDRENRDADMTHSPQNDDNDTLNRAAVDLQASTSENFQQANAYRLAFQRAIPWSPCSRQRAEFLMRQDEDPEHNAGPSFPSANENNDLDSSSDNPLDLSVSANSGRNASDHGSSTSQDYNSPSRPASSGDDSVCTSPRARFDLIPCKVCEDKSSGVHYGAVTCEGCKAFFRRCLPIHKDLKCSQEGNCPVDHANRNRCQHCRWKKCMEVGMSKAASKFGRKSKEELASLNKLEEPE
ncbi:uncharacterized protein LOC143452289 [Clavelina lepadiformis]|uniref:Nuclear receptor domain-containing protein n=1 Tax=Clavelina lepadiformis TaxID=159417 RepID=A0ABP0G1J1_CLALP